MKLTFILSAFIFLNIAYVHTSEDTLCEADWRTIGVHCYKVEGETENSTRTWEGAAAHCAEMGGHLASIHFREVNDQLVFLLGDSTTAAWIGLFYANALSRYQWDDGTPPDYIRFHPDRAHDINENETRCTALSAQYTNDKQSWWIETQCEDMKPFICQKDQNRSISDELNTTREVDYFSPSILFTNYEQRNDSLEYRTSCEEGWKQFGEYCYKLEGETNETRRTWEGSAYRCSELGGHLASFHSKRQIAFLGRSYLNFFATPYAWIGLHASNGTSGYQWDDGSSIDYYTRFFRMHSFGTGEPRCATLWYGHIIYTPFVWAERRCEEMNAFICQKWTENQINNEESHLTAEENEV